MFFTVTDVSNGFKFYGNTTNCTTIGGNDDLNTTGALSSASSSTTGNSIVGGNLIVTGSLITSSFHSIKPYISVYVVSNALSTTVKPGVATSTLNRSATGVYTFTLPAHPSGANYEVFVQQRTALATTAIAVYGVIVNSSTSFTVWSKTTANVLVDSDSYVRTVP